MAVLPRAVRDGVLCAGAGRAVAAQNQQNERKMCEVAGRYRSTTNIRLLAALYSIKNRKFVRGFFIGTRVEGEIKYRLYEGVYIKFDADYWSKNDPPYQVNVYIMRIHTLKIGRAHV